MQKFEVICFAYYPTDKFSHSTLPSGLRTQSTQNSELPKLVAIVGRWTMQPSPLGKLLYLRAGYVYAVEEEDKTVLNVDEDLQSTIPRP